MDQGGMQMQNQLQQQMQQQQQQEEKRKAIEEQRRVAMRSLLSPEAQERLSRIHLVKPEKAVATENFILQATRSGALQPPVSDAALIQVLERISGGQSGSNSANSRKVVIKRQLFDDDDSNDDL